MSEAELFTPEAFQDLRAQARGVNAERVDKLQAQRNRGIITFEEHVTELYLLVVESR